MFSHLKLITLCSERLQLLQRLLSCQLFGFFLTGSRALGAHYLGNTYLDAKYFPVIGARLANYLVAGRRQPSRLQQLLESRLVIGTPEVALRFDDPIDQCPHDEFAGRIETRVEVNGGHERLERVAQQGGLFPPARLLFTAAQSQVPAEVESSCGAREGGGVHKARPALGKLPLAPRWKRSKQIITHEHLEHGITQVFELFVIVGELFCPR